MGSPRKMLSGEAEYFAFVPKPLPPIPPVMLDEKAQMLLSNADRALGGLSVVIDLLPDSDYFIFSYLRKEATLSSKIEGTRATFIDVAKAEIGEIDEDTPNDHQEITNYIAAINHGLKRTKEEDFPFTLRLLREVHKKLLKDARGQHKAPGEFRQSQNWIGGATINTASYIPPAVEDMLPVLDNFEKFIHNKQPMPILVKIALIHSQFENIHPFLDGNGRIGRLLITLLLCHYNLLSKPTLYLSDYFHAYKQEYYDRLHGVHEKGDIESWVKFFLEGVWLVGEEATNTARKINKIKETDIKTISTNLNAKASKSAIALLDYLFRQPIAGVGDIERAVNLSFANANNLVKRLVEIGILQPLDDRKRNRLFSYQKYIQLFKERESYKRPA